MQTGEILLLATVTLVLLGGLVSLGVGHRRWSIGTVVAGFLVLLAAATYLYLAARLADRDRAWARKIDDFRLRLAKAQHDQAPDEHGRLGPPEGGPRSLERLRAERDRWSRGRDRVDTWRGRFWQGASFQPPKDDSATGRVELAADGNAEGSPPIGVGSHVFLFDAIPYEEGGAYVGEFLVQSTGYDQATKRHLLTVVQTAPRDEYDAKVLARPHDSVIVFEDLPVDRWLAFYRTRTQPAGDEGAVMPEPEKEDADTVRELLESAPEVGQLVDRFVETFAQHEEDVPQDESEAALLEQAREQPGILWATVVFTKPHSFAAAGAAPGEPVPDATAPATEGGPKRDYEIGDETEFDLQTAIDLRDGDGVVTIERVFRRRPLTDALTLLHGSKVMAGPGDGIRADGTTTLLRLLQDELATLELANRQLRTARAAATANTDDERKVADELARDLESWKRDARAAAELAAGFERERDRTKGALDAAREAIVDRGRELTALMDRLAREIDRVAPPPERRAARP